MAPPEFSAVEAVVMWGNVSGLTLRAAMPVERAAAVPLGAEWTYEVGWPGERVLAVKQDGGVRLIGALRRDVTNRFPVLAAALAKLNVTAAVFDAAIAALTREQRAAGDESGGGGAADAFSLIVSDLLSLDGNDVRQQPYRERRDRVRDLVRATGLLIAPVLPAAPRRMLEAARQHGAEAIVARRSEARYRPFTRTGDWVRVSVEDADRWLQNHAAAMEAGADANWSERAGGWDPLWSRG